MLEEPTFFFQVNFLSKNTKNFIKSLLRSAVFNVEYAILGFVLSDLGLTPFFRIVMTHV